MGTGSIGSDDLILSPSDPGYNSTIHYNGTGSVISPTHHTAAYGAFVDMGWALKMPFVPMISHSGFYTSSLSGLEFHPPPSPPPALRPMPSTALRKSGRVLLPGTLPSTPTWPLTVQIYQPCFDSTSTFYEHDGWRQRDRIVSANNATNAGTIFVNGDFAFSGMSNTSPPIAATPPTPDLAINSLDDDSNGIIDDYQEQDASPPIVNAMTAIQAMIRLEDVTAGVIQQIAVTHELAPQ